MQSDLTIASVAKIKPVQNPVPVVQSTKVVEPTVPIVVASTSDEKVDSDSDESFLELHKLYCFLCSTDTHTTVDCPVPPPMKIILIKKNKLCKSCLSPVHNSDKCNLKNACKDCQMPHLDYIYHKPYD